MAYDIFLSYRRSDQAIARALVGELEKRGVAVWWDQNIEGGEDWRDAIVAGLTDANALIILFSDDCNSSKQLKKELAIADTLDKLVVPVLIEDTQPKGHFLYELAARNWIQIFPNAQKKAGELAERLAREVQDLRPASSQPAPAASAPAAESLSVGETIGAPGTVPPQAPPRPTPAPQPQISPDAVERKARKAEAAAERKKRREEARKTLRDFLPFRWIDAVPILAVGALFFFMVMLPDLHYNNEMETFGQVIGIGALGLSAYGALVFPIRYYLRKRRVSRAAIMYLLSSVVLFGLFFAGLVAYWEGDIEYAMEEAQFGLVVYAVFAVIAITIYAILHGQRLVRSFRKNVEVI